MEGDNLGEPTHARDHDLARILRRDLRVNAPARIAGRHVLGIFLGIYQR
jgi:hypothetical protein